MFPILYISKIFINGSNVLSVIIFYSCICKNKYPPGNLISVIWLNSVKGLPTLNKNAFPYVWFHVPKSYSPITSLFYSKLKISYVKNILV